jgi:hypothetical protein
MIIRFPDYLLYHSNGLETNAAQWLRTFYGDTPFSETYETFFCETLPEFYPTKTTKEISSFKLPLTFKDLHLVVFKDHTAVLTQKTSKGYNVFPGTLSFPNFLPINPEKPWANDLALVPNEECVYLTGETVTQDIYDALLEKWEERFYTILTSFENVEPVCDPRFYLEEKIGRYAPFSPFPKVPKSTIDRVEEFLTSLTVILNQKGIPVETVIINRPKKQSFWKPKKDNSFVHVFQKDGTKNRKVAAFIEKAMRDSHLIEKSYFYSETEKNLLKWHKTLDDGSAHAALKALSLISDLNLETDLIALNKGT